MKAIEADPFVASPCLPHVGAMLALQAASPLCRLVLGDPHPPHHCIDFAWIGYYFLHPVIQRAWKIDGSHKKLRVTEWGPRAWEGLAFDHDFLCYE